jgi:hypothetical protein
MSMSSKGQTTVMFAATDMALAPIMLLQAVLFSNSIYKRSPICEQHPKMLR